MHRREGTLMKRYHAVVESLPAAEQEEWKKVVSRLQRICEDASKKNIGVLVDAEESWIQDPVDALTIPMMDTFNRSKAVVFNTIQLYRHDRLAFLKTVTKPPASVISLGSKLVRAPIWKREEARCRSRLSVTDTTRQTACDNDYKRSCRFLHSAYRPHIPLS